LSGGVGLREYVCFICGRRFSSAQGLRSHIRVHKRRGEYCEVSFLAVRSVYEDFKRMCREHGLTTCHMFNSFMHMMVQAFRNGATVEIDPRTETMRVKVGRNPVTFQLIQYFAGPPRSRRKYDFSRLGAVEEAPRCLICGSEDVGYEVYRDDGTKGYLCRRHKWYLREFRGYREVG